MAQNEMWADGAPKIKAWHIMSIGGETQEEADEAWEVYDRLSHNEVTPEGIIQEFIEAYGSTPDTDDPEFICRDLRCCGGYDDYVLTLDPYTGTFDIWQTIKK